MKPDPILKGRNHHHHHHEFDHKFTNHKFSFIRTFTWSSGSEAFCLYTLIFSTWKLPWHKCLTMNGDIQKDLNTCRKWTLWRKLNVVFRCRSIFGTYPGELVGWLVHWSIADTFRFPLCRCLWTKAQSVRRPQDIIYFLKAMTNSFQTSTSMVYFSKV